MPFQDVPPYLLRYLFNTKINEAYLNPFVDGQLDEADGGVVGHGVQVVLPPPVHARRYEPAAIKARLGQSIK
jgi:hypothetical protein